MADNSWSHRWAQHPMPQQQDQSTSVSGRRDVYANVLSNPFTSSRRTSTQNFQAVPAPALIDYRYAGMLPATPGSFQQPHLGPGPIGMESTTLTSSSPCALMSQNAVNSDFSPLSQPYQSQGDPKLNNHIDQSLNEASGPATSEMTSATPKYTESDPFTEIIEQLMNAQEGERHNIGGDDTQTFDETSRLAPYRSVRFLPDHRDMQSADLGNPIPFENLSQEDGLGLGGWNDASVPLLVDVNGEAIWNTSTFGILDSAIPKKRVHDDGGDEGRFETAEGPLGFGAATDHDGNTWTADPSNTRPQKRIRGIAGDKGHEATISGAWKPKPQVNTAQQVIQSRLGKATGTSRHESNVEELHHRRKKEHRHIRHSEGISAQSSKEDGNVQASDAQPRQRGRSGAKWPADPFASSMSQKLEPSRLPMKRSHQGHFKGLKHGLTEASEDGAAAPVDRQIALPAPQGTQNHSLTSIRTTVEDTNNKPQPGAPTHKSSNAVRSGVQNFNPVRMEGQSNFLANAPKRSSIRPKPGKRVPEQLNGKQATQSLPRDATLRASSARDASMNLGSLRSYPTPLEELGAAILSPRDSIEGDHDDDDVIGPVRRRRPAPNEGLRKPESSTKPVTDLVGDEEEEVDGLASLFEEDAEDHQEMEEDDDTVGKKRRRKNASTEKVPAPFVQRAAKLVASTTNLNRKTGNRSRLGEVIAQSMSPLAMSSFAVPPQATPPGAIPPQAAAPVVPLRHNGKHLPPGHPTQLYIKRSVNLSQPPLDYREKEPETQEAYKSLQEALRPTRVAYYEWIGTDAPATDGWQSYMDQWRQIQASFVFAWSMRKNMFAKRPRLFRLPPWSTSVENWPELVKDDFYFAPFKYGHCAPIREDGKLMDLPGALLEEASQAKDRSVFMDGVMHGLKHLAPAVWNHHYR